MTADELVAKVAHDAEELGLPGVAVGVYHDGVERHAVHGVTSIENPLVVDAGTLFPINSTGKTFTGTALLCLVDRGLVELAAPVRRYVPDLKLADEAAARDVTVLQLLNHTAGWDGSLFADTGQGDDALARYVAQMCELEQLTPVGSTVTYNNAALTLAGHLMERVGGKRYEELIGELLLAPLELRHASFEPAEIMTRRFAVGHRRTPDGALAVVRPWEAQRSMHPMGGLAMPIGELMAWARFHLRGDGRGPNGSTVLSGELLARMQSPTAHWPDSPWGDATVGISWLMREIDGVQVVFHDGDGGGHHSGFVMVPEREFALAVLTNGSDGRQLRDDLQRWALEAYLGIVEREPEVAAFDPASSAEYVGQYVTNDATFRVSTAADALVLDVWDDEEGPPEQPADSERERFPQLRLGMLADEPDHYVIVAEPHKGLRGRFERGPSGAIERMHFGGLLATRREP